MVQSLNWTIHGREIQLFRYIINSQIMENENGLLTWSIPITVRSHFWTDTKNGIFLCFVGTTLQNIIFYFNYQILYHNFILLTKNSESEVEWKCMVNFRAVSFHPVPWAMARVVFMSRKKIDERFQSNATFLFSKIKWKIWENDKLISACLNR